MELEKENLLKALKQLQPGLSNKDIVEQAVCFNFHSDRIVTHNDFISICIPFEAGIEGAVKADDLYKILDKVTSPRVTLVLQDNEVRLSSGKIKAGLSITSTLLSEVQVENEFLPIDPELIDALKFCQFSVGKDMTRPNLTCVHVEGNKVTSSDNIRVTQVEMETEAPINFLIPGNAIAHLSSYQFTHIAKDRSWLHFAEEETGTVFSVRLIAADLLQADRFLEVDGIEIELPADLMGAIDRAKIMAEGAIDQDLQIKIILQPGKLICSGEKETGWIQEEVEIAYDGPEITFYIHPVFLNEILNKTNSAVIGNLILFSGPSFRHAIMPLSSEGA